MTPGSSNVSNPPAKVLITGATGFIGSRLCEILSLTKFAVPRAFVHSTATAARITRFPLDFFVGDLCDRKSVQRAMEGCDAVVHLARGDKRVMRVGLENVLRAAADQGVSRFVHMSSVAVYGNHPPPESTSEAAPAKRTDMEYGNEKLRQEERVLKYGRRRGLPIVILRPPNVSGPFSGFSLDLMNRIRGGRLAIVEAGQNPCNLVYVDNLVEAVLLALCKPEATGEIFFITDSGALSWERCLNDHAALLGRSLPRVSATELVDKPAERYIRDSLRAVPRVLLAGELRGLLREIPAIRSIESVFYAGFQSLSGESQQKIRHIVQGPLVFEKNGTLDRSMYFRDNIHQAQCRKVAHSSEKARRLLGYSALVSYREGMELTEAWLRYCRFL
jgi:nucleoside-diphosphate-sugar epimerase